jgi:galactokinase
MDQFAVACAREEHALLLDCRSLETTDVSVPADFGLLVVDSGVRHRLPDGAYNDRATECADALRILAAANPGLESLRDANPQMIDSQRQVLGETLHRRCRHVITENERVLRAVDALHDAALGTLGELLSESHRSLRDDFAVSCPEVDRLVELANSVSAVAGSRMIGGGFGGCVLVMAAAVDMPAVAESIRDEYVALFNREPWLHRVTPASPAGEVLVQ